MGLDKPEDIGKRAGKMVGLGLAGALAAGSPAHAQEYDSGYSDSGTEYSDYSYQPSQEVLDFFNGLDKEIGNSLSITQEEIATIHAAVDDFMAKNPPREGRSHMEDGKLVVDEPSYSPWTELQEGMWWGPEKNPIVIGLTLAYLKEKTVAPEAPTEHN